MPWKLGRIKWYGDKQRKLKYGFISELDGEDYYFREENCDWTPNPKDEFAYVIFRESNRSRPGRRTAETVTMISGNTDPSLIDGISSYLIKPEAAGAWRHLGRVRGPDEVYSLYGSLASQMLNKKFAIAALPRRFFLGQKGAELRQHIKPDLALSACLAFSADVQDSDETTAAIIQEAIGYMLRIVEDDVRITTVSLEDSVIQINLLGLSPDTAMVKKIAASILSGNYEAKNALLSICTEYLSTDDIIKLGLGKEVNDHRLTSALRSRDAKLIKYCANRLIDGELISRATHSDLAWLVDLIPAAIKSVTLDALGPVWTLIKHTSRENALRYLTNEAKLSILKSTYSQHYHNEVGIPEGQSYSNDGRTAFINSIDPEELLKTLPTLPSASRLEWFSQLELPTQQSIWTCLQGTELLIAHHMGIARPESVMQRLGDDTPAHVVKYVAISLAADRRKAFADFHQSLIDWAVTSALEHDRDILLDEYLPACPKKVTRYCEGRPWPSYKSSDEEDNRAFAYCPRINNSCNAMVSNTSGHAHISPLDMPDYKHFTLLEYLDRLEIAPNVEGLSKPGEYTNKLAGWVNRLNEIRERLKCSTCGSIMTGNMRYAKNLARYSMTVASCREGDGHDKNIYLNHCWNCHSIIDSRESKIQVNGFYLCIHCGAGDPAMKTVTPGSICPSCGNTDSSRITLKGSRIQCASCKHLFTYKKPRHSSH